MNLEISPENADAIKKELEICEKMWTKHGFFKDDDRRLLHACNEHEDTIYSARTKEETLQAALSIVWNRIRYCYPNKREVIPPKPFQEGQNIPESLEKEAYKQVNRWISDKDWKERSNEIYDLVQIVQAEIPVYSGLAAFYIIELRQEHEYENWYFEHLGDTEHYIRISKERIAKDRELGKKSAA